MSFSRFIHDYLDGELGDVQKEALFAELAKDSRLRNEFDKQMKLHIISKNDLNSISIPLGATNAVFSSLGFSLPSDEYLSKLSSSQSVQDNVRFDGIKKTMKRSWPVLLAILLTTTITGTIFFSFFGINSLKFGTNGQSGTIAGKGSNIPVISSFDGDNSTQSMSDNSADLKANQNNHKSDNINSTGNNLTRQVIRKSSGTDNNPHLMSDNYQGNSNVVVAANSEKDNVLNNHSYPKIIIETQGNSNSSLNAHDQFGINQSSNRGRTISGESFGKVDYSMINNINLPEYKQFSLSLRRLPVQSTISFDNQEELSPGNSGLNGYGLNVNYRFDSNHSLGIELGKEQFAQSFVNDNDTYKQVPTYFWIGTVYRLSLPEVNIANMIYPYAQAFAGYTSSGPLLRPMLGLTFEPVRSLSFNVGYEYAIMLYNVDGTIYNTGKYGLTYGLSYSF
jgi:hypothetical protein